MRFEDVQNPMILARWQEIVEHSITVERVEPDDEDGDGIVVHLDSNDADTWGIYEVLWISPAGRVAEAMVAMPYFYPTFSTLLTAAAARTASS